MGPILAISKYIDVGIVIPETPFNHGAFPITENLISMCVNKEGIVNAKAIIKWKILVNGASIPQFNVEIVK